jgi:glucose-1-phosphate cytidylyltransferase
MTVVILCGGQGTRAYPLTDSIPKAMMRVGDAPIVEQVMRIYASFGYGNFVLSVGYLKEHLLEFAVEARKRYGWNVECVDTGGATDTGGRILGVREYVTPTFHATYCDGLGDIDLDGLLRFHEQHGRLATMTGVQLRSQYGIVRFDDGGMITRFEEKPVIPDRWINAGFFVLDERAFDAWSGDNLERHVMPEFARRRELYIYQHHGFWRSMDTYKDQQELTPLWQEFAPRYTQEASAMQAETISP